MAKRDCYEILGLSSDSSSEEIKKTYRRLALKYHPDRNPGDKEAEEKFKEAAEAYSILIDPEKKSIYDRFGYEGLRGQGINGFSGFNSSIFEEFEDILGDFFGFGFGDFFGTRKRRKAGYPSRGRDLVLELEISLREAAFSAEKEIRINRAEICHECHGTKMRPGTQKNICPYCHGKGEVRMQQGFFMLSRTCSHCNGTGEIISYPCKLCKGSGKIKEKRNLKIKIPQGVAEGMKLRIVGEGEAGDRGASRGDLYVIIHIKKHEFFERENDDLLCEISIPFVQASLGVTVKVPTLDGKESLKIPPGTQPGEIFKLKGKGIRNFQGYKKGDLFVKINIRTPKNLTKKQKEFLRAFAQSRDEDVELTRSNMFGGTKNIFH